MPDVTQALIDAINARWQAPQDLGQRDAEHAAFTRYLLQQYPYLGPLIAMITVPGYSGAKWLAQTLPGGAVVDRVSPVPLASATPPSWREVLAGLSPLWEGSR